METTTTTHPVAAQATTGADDTNMNMHEEEEEENEDDDSDAEVVVDVQVVHAMIDACATGNLELVQQIVQQQHQQQHQQQQQQQQQHNCRRSNNSNNVYNTCCRQQLDTTGASPLMAAAAGGHVDLCHYLLEQGSAPWNAVDRHGQCAGNYATDAQHWEVVNLLVEWGTRAELILGRVERGRRLLLRQQKSNTTSAPSGGATLAATDTATDTTTDTTTATTASAIPVEHEPCTKPDYLQQRLQYTADGQSLLDADKDAVMMEWERPLMRAHVEILMEPEPGQAISRKRVLNVGFGMGIFDSVLQQQEIQHHQPPAHHIIIEAHPDVYRRMLETGWGNDAAKAKNIRICYGKWQDVLPQLIAEGVVVDAIFYDTYGEHFLDLEDFHALMVQILAKPGGIYSFFNGLAPDNIFFHGVACNCVKLQLAALGLDSEFLPCEMSAVNDEVWEGVRRKYWHGRDTYYLPVCKWNSHFLLTGQAPAALLLDVVAAEAVAGDSEAARKRKVAEPSGGGDDQADMETDCCGGDTTTTKRPQQTAA